MLHSRADSQPARRLAAFPLTSHHFVATVRRSNHGDVLYSLLHRLRVVVCTLLRHLSVAKSG